MPITLTLSDEAAGLLHVHAHVNYLQALKYSHRFQPLDTLGFRISSSFAQEAKCWRQIGESIEAVTDVEPEDWHNPYHPGPPPMTTLEDAIPFPVGGRLMSAHGVLIETEDPGTPAVLAAKAAQVPGVPPEATS